MRELIPLAVTLKEAAGTYATALEWTDVIQARGAATLGHLGLHGDAALVLTDEAQAAGMLTPAGMADRVRLAQLVVVLDTLAALPPEPSELPQAEPLVFTARIIQKSLVGTSPTRVCAG